MLEIHTGHMRSCENSAIFYISGGTALFLSVPFMIDCRITVENAKIWYNIYLILYRGPYLSVFTGFHRANGPYFIFVKAVFI